MSIAFDKNRWDKVKENHDLWWDGKLGRPIITCTLENREPDFPKPKLPLHYFTSFYDLNVPVDDILDVWDYEFSKQTYYGDAYPRIIPYFGAGVIAAYLGCELHNGIEQGTTWFSPKKEISAKELKLTVDFDNIWFKRLLEIYKKSIERWEDKVQYCMTDLGGNLDIVSSFLPSEKLLFSLYDEPDEVKRLGWEAHDAWWIYFDAIKMRLLILLITAILHGPPLFSTDSYYMLQCDFCYMIGPDMFDEFVKPELDATCKKLKNAFYHLDGVGELPHLDSLLSIPELKGIQWVPGAGHSDVINWPDLYKRIVDAGKLIQIWGNAETISVIADKVGKSESIYMEAYCKNESEAQALMDLYNI